MAAVFVPFSALVMNAFSGDSEDDFDFSLNGSQAPGDDGLWCRRYDPLGLVDGEFAADGV